MTEEQYNDELKNIFIYETEEQLRLLEEILAAAEGSEAFSMEQTNELFRVMHTMKGSAAMMKHNVLSKAAHRLEDLFAAMRQNERYEDKQIVAETISVLFAALAYFRQAVESLLKDRPIAEMPRELQQSVLILEAKCCPNGGAKDESSKDKSSKDKSAAAVRPAGPVLQSPEPQSKEPDQSGGKYRVRVKLKPMPLPCMRALVVVKAIKKYCSTVMSVPPELEKHPELTEQVAAEGFILDFTPLDGITAAEVLELLQQNAYVAGCALEVQEKPQSVEQQRENNGNGDRLVSVRQSKLDRHIDLLSELAITEGLLEDKLQNQGLISDEIERLLALTRKSIKGLYNSAVSMNLVEADSLLFRLRLLAREMCAKQGKDVEVKCSGGKVEADKLVLDKLYEPLMHIVRNAIDHGIQDPVSRLEKGKKAQGLLLIEVTSQNDILKITVTDDGEGIDKQKVLQKAQQLGFIDSLQTEFSQREINDLLLQPGFSTSSQVTEYSGRGVGLDVVNTGLRKLGGSLAVDSTAGLGSSFILTIPTTLSVLEGLELELCDLRFLIPVSAISRIIQLGVGDSGGWTLETDSRQDGDNCYLKNKEISVPVLDLARQLGLERLLQVGGTTYIITDNGNDRFALRVDDIGEIRSIVIKELPQVLSGLQKTELCYSGCAVLGDGTICLLLDPSKLAV